MVAGQSECTLFKLTRQTMPSSDGASASAQQAEQSHARRRK